HHRGEIHRSPAELAEDAVPEGFEIVPSACTGGLVDGRTAIFEMHVPHAVAVLLQDRQGVAAAKPKVARIQTKTHQFRVRQSEQPGDFVGRLNETGGVMMKHRPQPGLITDRASHELDSFSERGPLLTAQSFSGTNSSGVLGSYGILAVVVG